ncbi:O-antigen ligase family protein, partial [candidate division KSB1 bacterium]|nr:O-antigen ligase family protein [candidate division KSB1 bacterium]
QARGESAAPLERVGGTLGHPNRLAMFLEVLLPLTLGLFLTAGRRSARGFALFAFFIGSSAMILTGSRGGWIATAVAFAFLIAVALKHKRIQSKQVWRLGLLAGIGLAVVGFFFSEQLENRITGEDHGSAMSRIPMFQIAFSIIEEHPVGGVGINNYAVIMQQYNDTILGRRFSTIPRPVHNMYLLIGGETGAIGLVTFGVFLFALLRLLWRIVRAPSPNISVYALALLAGILAFLVHGLVDKHPPGGYPLFYLFMALAVVLPEMISAKKEDGL